MAYEIDDNEIRLVPARYTLESVGASVEPATATEDFEQIVKDAKQERAITRIEP